MTEATEVYATEGPSVPIAMGWIMIIGGAVLAAVSFFYNVGVSTARAACTGCLSRSLTPTRWRSAACFSRAGSRLSCRAGCLF